LEAKPQSEDKKTERSWLDKAASWCAYQERSQHELRGKLMEWACPPSLAEEIISRLIGEGFVNEERFAKAYAGGKFRMKQWGRLKIMQGLRGHQITPRNIQSGLEEIPEEAYKEALLKQADKKWRLSTGNALQRKGSVMRYLLSKGYEQELIYQALHSLGKD
jgi:regulatory protein